MAFTLGLTAATSAVRVMAAMAAELQISNFIIK